jgi:hypothetical protein
MDINSLLSGMTISASFTQNIIGNLMGKINKSSIVLPTNKLLFNDYVNSNIGRFGTNNPLEEISEDSIVVSFLFNNLTDLNKYDYNLINTGYNIGLTSDSILYLLMLNNLDDVNDFCTDHNIHGQKQYNIITLKKLSALYKIQHNF